MKTSILFESCSLSLLATLNFRCLKQQFHHVKNTVMYYKLDLADLIQANFLWGSNQRLQ